MMIVLGLSLGVYYLMEDQDLSGSSLGGVQAAMWTRALIVVGLVVGGTAVSGIHGFEAASSCTSSLSVFVPWAVYWTGLVLAAGLLVGTYRLGSGNVRQLA